MISLKYKMKDVRDFDSLIEQPFDLKSPFRSTVPHLAYWSNPNERLGHFTDRLALPISHEASLTFEYMTLPIQGQGNASHTDLMIVSSQVAICIEAKYTETEYPLVSTWLGESPSENKRLVLEGWLDLIYHATGCRLTVENVQNCTYQLIHRTASACSIQTEQRMVVYHCFDLSPERQQYYTNHLRTVAGLIAATDRLNFALFTNTLLKSDPYCRLQMQWKMDKSHDFSEEIRKLLQARNIATFNDSVVLRIA